MAVEIERKFLVTGDGWRQGVTGRKRIRQAYLATTSRTTLRVRVTDDAMATITIKSAVAGLSRDEFEYAIPLSDAEALIALREGAEITKTRHVVADGDLTWEVDVFEGDNEGLVIAEIELDDAGRAVPGREWLGREVTDDRRYYNADLAVRPYASWPRAT